MCSFYFSIDLVAQFGETLRSTDETIAWTDFRDARIAAINARSFGLLALEHAMVRASLVLLFLLLIFRLEFLSHVVRTFSDELNLTAFLENRMSASSTTQQAALAYQFFQVRLSSTI